MSLNAVVKGIGLQMAAARLGAAEDEPRNQAIAGLIEGGELSLPILRRTLRHSHLRTQCAAAVALHALHQPDGMEMLIEALQWRLQSDPSLAPELEAAFIAIGSPDAVDALLLLWKRTPESGTHRHTLESICRVWAILRDPRVIDALIQRASRLPDLFVSTLPAFGEMAIAPLERMIHSPEPSHRILAARALSQVLVPRAFTVLVPLLRDSDSHVRDVVPEALAQVGGHFMAGKAVLEALRDGYSTGAAIQELASGATAPYDDFLDLISRWRGTLPMSERNVPAPNNDTPDAVVHALRLFAHAPYPHPRLVGVVTELMERQPENAIARQALILASSFQRAGIYAVRLSAILQAYITHPDGELRAHAAEALFVQGDPLGRHVIQFLNENRPNAGLFGQLQAVVRGDVDPGRVAVQAIQQMGQWVTRLSRDTAERLTPTGSRVPSQYRSSELIALLTRLLENLLAHAAQNRQPDVITALGDTIAVCTALARIAPESEIARAPLLRALMSSELPAFHPSIRGVRSAAASALLALYGTDSFPLFIEALYVPRDDVVPAAIAALAEIGDVRALPHLQGFVSAPNHPCAALAAEAASAIKRAHPEMMTLLRASMGQDAQAETLLRPILTSPADTSPKELLRPSEQ